MNEKKKRRETLKREKRRKRVENKGREREGKGRSRAAAAGTVYGVGGCAPPAAPRNWAPRGQVRATTLAYRHLCAPARLAAERRRCLSGDPLRSSGPQILLNLSRRSRRAWPACSCSGWWLPVSKAGIVKATEVTITLEEERTKPVAAPKVVT